MIRPTAPTFIEAFKEAPLEKILLHGLFLFLTQARVIIFISGKWLSVHFVSINLTEVINEQ